jgi:hypothetical protein
MSIVKGVPTYLINKEKRRNTPYFFTTNGAYFLDDGQRLDKAEFYAKYPIILGKRNYKGENPDKTKVS